jgi:hypothetical protein
MAWGKRESWQVSEDLPAFFTQQPAITPSMPEMVRRCETHSQSQPFAGRGHIRVAHGSARLRADGIEAAAAASMPSAKGKNASKAITDQSSRQAHTGVFRSQCVESNGPGQTPPRLCRPIAKPSLCQYNSGA